MENNTNIKRYKVPQDILMDILRILFKNNIKHQITGIQERENIILLNVHLKQNNIKSEEAQENISSILEDYSQYMKGLLGDTMLVLDDDEETE